MNPRRSEENSMPFKPRIAVVAALYKAPVFLEEQLDSIRLQSLKADQVILVDDASDDRTYERAQAYVERHHLNWTLLRQPLNQGYIRTFARALAAADADLVFLCDQDDLWRHDKLEVQSRYFQLPGTFAVTAPFWLMDASGTILQRTKSHSLKASRMKVSAPMLAAGPSPASEAAERLSVWLEGTRQADAEEGWIEADFVMQNNPAPGCTMAITVSLKNQYLELLEQNPDLYSLPHDWALAYLASLQQGLMLCRQPLTFYRQHESNAVGLSRAKGLEKRLKDAQTDACHHQLLANLIQTACSLFFFAPDPLLEEKMEQSDALASLYQARARILEEGRSDLLPFLAYRAHEYPALQRTILMDAALLQKDKAALLPYTLKKAAAQTSALLFPDRSDGSDQFAGLRFSKTASSGSDRAKKEPAEAEKSASAVQEGVNTRLVQRKRPGISVVLAACNGEPWISAQIESIVSQLQPQDELIISLDPSHDATKKIAAAYAREDSRIRLLEGPGKGAAANFERGLENARNEIIFFSDQDDVWHPAKVERVLAGFADPDVSCVLHDARLIDADGKELAPSYFELHHSKGGFMSNVLRNSMMGCCMAFRKSVLLDALPIPKGMMHDQWIGLRAMKQGSVKMLRDPLIDYRRHENNVSPMKHLPVSRMLKNRFTLLKALGERR